MSSSELKRLLGLPLQTAYKKSKAPIAATPHPVITSLVKSEQFYSVVLHELGHSRGLDHSCQLNSSGTPGYISCSKIGASHPYTLAVMFPTLGPNLRGGLEVKETLEKNDINRAQCAAKAHSSW